MQGLERKAVFVQFLPAYSSEFNYIEILWKRIKHQGLDIADWISTQTLKGKDLDILKKFGQEYVINFQI
jgi:transposase